MISIAANHKGTISIMNIDVALAEAQRLVLVRLLVEDNMGADTGEFCLLKKRVCTAHGTQQAIGSVCGKNTSKSWRIQKVLSSKNLFRQKGHRVSGLTHGDHFVLTGPTDRLTEF